MCIFSSHLTLVVIINQNVILQTTTQTKNIVHALTRRMDDHSYYSYQVLKSDLCFGIPWFAIVCQKV